MQKGDKNRPVTAVIVGCGHRSMIYASYAKEHPDQLKIVGAADPSEKALRQAAEEYDIKSERLFASAQALAAVPPFADVVINGTMDQQHVQTSLPLLRAGYDMLLEKPFAVTADEARELLDCARQNGNRVMVCHVLRYAHFYQAIKKRLLAGEIGKIITIASNEYVSYDHMVTSYVRGKWAKFENCHSSMLLAKCSHDIDILTWLLGTDHPRSVCSFGSRSLFRTENAPKEAGSRCTLDCPLVDRCPYSAKRIYLDRPGAWDGYVWKDFGCKRPDSMAVMLESLSTDNPYGRCVFRCDNDVVDRQSVLIEFQSGAIGSHNMIGGAAGGGRTIHITGTAGEIYGSFEQQKLHIKHIHPTPDSLFDEEVLDFSDEDLSGHGGGDARLMEDLIRFVRGEETSVSCTGLADSMPGHMTVFMADKSRLAGGAPQKIALGDAINTY